MSATEMDDLREDDSADRTSRRSVFAGLLGIAGLAGLAGCRDLELVAGTGDELRYAAGSGDVLDSVAALRPVSPTSANRSVIVLGMYQRGDGGGGVFLYDASSSAVDDGTTVVRPDSVLSGSPGRFVRLIAGRTVSPRLFGAGATDDTAAVNAALAYLVGMDGGGTLLIDGTFRVTQPIVIPHHSSRPIRIVGLGRSNSVLVGDGIASGSPLLSVGAPTGPYGTFIEFRIEGLTLTRNTNGPTFEHYYAAAVSGDAATRRLENAIFRDLNLVTTSQAGGNTFPNLRLQFPGNSTFEDINLIGGQTAMQVLWGTRSTFRNVRTTLDSTCTYGVHFVGGGTMKLENVRIEATSGGFGVKLEGCTGMIVDSLSFEGKRTNPQIWIADGHDICIRGASTASRTQLASNTEYRAGVRIDGSSSLITFQNGVLFPKENDLHTSSVAIDVGPNCREVRFEDVGIARFDGDDSLVHTEISVHPSALDVELELRFVNFPVAGVRVAQSRYRVRSAVPTIASAPTISVRNADTFMVTGTSPITSLVHAHPGQKTTLVFLTIGATVTPSATIKLASTFVANAVGATLDLVSDGTTHFEVSRRTS